MLKEKSIFNILRLIPIFVFIGCLLYLFAKFKLSAEYNIRVIVSVVSAIIIIALLFLNITWGIIFSEFIFLLGTFNALFITEVTNSITLGLNNFIGFTIQPLLLFLFITHTILNFYTIRIAAKKMWNYFN